jgi:hypothetical protein
MVINVASIHNGHFAIIKTEVSTCGKRNKIKAQEGRDKQTNGKWTMLFRNLHRDPFRLGLTYKG